jgi:hypothetical protein
METTKKAYQEKVDAQLDEIKAQIGLLKAKAEKAKAEAKIKYNQQLEDLRQKRETVESRLEQLKMTGGEAWRELKTGVDEAMKNLENAVTDATAQFRR